MIIPTLLIIPLTNPGDHHLTRRIELRFVIRDQSIVDTYCLSQGSTSEKLLSQSMGIISLLILHDESDTTRSLIRYRDLDIHDFRKSLGLAFLQLSIFILDLDDLVLDRLTGHGNRKRGKDERILIHHSPVVILLLIRNDLILSSHGYLELWLIEAAFQVLLIHDVYRDWSIRIDVNLGIGIIQHLQSSLEDILGIECTQPCLCALPDTKVPLHQNIRISRG